jgi:hypothetical protein
MKNVDWPLAILLGVVFVVMSVVRWRYFQSLARRRRTPPRVGPPPGCGGPAAAGALSRFL